MAPDQALGYQMNGGWVDLTRASSLDRAGFKDIILVFEANSNCLIHPVMKSGPARASNGPLYTGIGGLDGRLLLICRERVALASGCLLL